MPQYIYQNPKTKEVKVIIQGINENHVFEEGGVVWERVWTVPQSSIDTKIDPFSERDFREKTEKKKETVGSLWDRSREASESRGTQIGKDPIKQKFYENWSKRRRGRKHPNATAEGY